MYVGVYFISLPMGTLLWQTKMEISNGLDVSTVIYLFCSLASCVFQK